jgi:hypothetical protein
MPTEDYLQILVYKAMDRGHARLAIREFVGTLFAKGKNNFELVQLQKINYAPSWAKVEAAIYVSGRDTKRTAGDNGTIILDAQATDMETFEIHLYNKSIDTEVMYTLHLIGWQAGEG